MKSFSLVLWLAFLSTVVSGCAPRTSVEPISDSNENETVKKSLNFEPIDGLADTETRYVSSKKPVIEYDPLDWLYWRGPEWNGYSRETGLIDDWDPKEGSGSNVKWKRDDVAGISTPVVMNGKLYTLMQAEPDIPSKNGEKVVCLNAETGEKLWENRFNVYLSDVPDTRVGWSSVVADPDSGNVYAQGVCGLFQCIDAETGKTKWKIPLHERFGLLSTYGGRTNYPVIVDDLVICSAVIIGWGDMAKPAHRFIAFNKHTGDVVWFNGTRLLPYDTTYSGPTVTVINGQKVMVFGSGDGAVWAFKPRTGEPIWQYRLSRRGLNASPLVSDTTVFAGHSEENIVGTAMGALASIDATKTGDITESGENWKREEVMAGRTQPLLIGDRLWVFDDRAKLLIFDAKSGEQIGRRIALGTQMRSSPLYADGKVYACTANGRWYILVPDDRRGAKILKKGRFPSGDGVIASPIASHGRIYIQSTGALYCLEDESKTHGVTPRPEPPAEADVASDSKPAHLQVVPAEVLMRPGEEQAFVAKLYNARGQYLKTIPASFKVDGPGAIDAAGNYTVGTEGAHQAAIVTAVGENGLTGQARIRIVPPLPWKFDFDDIALDPQTGLGEPPITWVGCRYRHVIRKENGNNVMVKITTIPKGTRSRCWMGQSDLHDYTMQADVRGSIVDNKMPDIGLIVQGYTLDLKGESQELQIRSWVTQERMAKTIPFPWKPETWYVMKFRSENVGDKVVLRGKVWPKGTAEPPDWTLIAEDDVPVRTGSPGLFGNAKDAEIWLDNISVTPNEPGV